MAFDHNNRAYNTNATEIIVPLILNEYKPTSVLYVGCGIGTWLSVFQKKGDSRYHGNNLKKIKSSKQFLLINEFFSFPTFKHEVYNIDLYRGNHNIDYRIIYEAFSFEVEKIDVFKSGNLLDSKLNLIYVEKVNIILTE
ncbi:MAG: hypothetical protein SNJ64_05230 [Endomicrobiia bacterium]